MHINREDRSIYDSNRNVILKGKQQINALTEKLVPFPFENIHIIHINVLEAHACQTFDYSPYHPCKFMQSNRDYVIVHQFTQAYKL